MAVETELKLRIAPADMERLKHHPFLETLAAAPASERKLYNVYYDTPSLDLHRHEMALRLRRIGDQWLQTLKGGGGVEAGLHTRNEWETGVAGEALDFAALQRSGVKLPPGVERKLQPVFRTDFSRSIRLLNFEGAAVELCLDSGEIIAGAKTRRISELELELKSGEPRQLFQLALSLLDIVPLEVEHASKAEYGYGLHSDARRAPTEPQLPLLDKSQSTAAALRSLISACLLHVQANLTGAVQEAGGQYLEQASAGLTRLRVALSMANGLGEKGEAEGLCRQVAGLCAEFDRAQEWDAFVMETLPSLRAKFPSEAGLDQIVRGAGDNRAQHHASMRASLASQDFQRLLLRIGQWMLGRHWQGAPAEHQPLAGFAARVLADCHQRVTGRGDRPAEFDAAGLDALRAVCRELHDSAELLRSLFEADRVNSYFGALAGLYASLNTLTRLVAAPRLLRELGGEALVPTWREPALADGLAELKREWARFAVQRPFWD